MQTRELTEFYKGYVQWVEGGAPEDHPVYTRWFGLCCSTPWELFTEMRGQFVSHGLSKRYPFNKSPEDYTDEGVRKAMYLNPLRLQWCKDRIAEATSRADRR